VGATNSKEFAEMGRSSGAPLQNDVKVLLGRRYRFAASHRLHTDKLSEDENARVFGKCNNPYGHGHNYVLEINLSGPINPATGMIANLADLDGFVERACDCKRLQIIALNMRGTDSVAADLTSKQRWRQL
jgi:6-pyruvoyl tetrahydropterin synthase